MTLVSVSAYICISYYNDRPIRNNNNNNNNNNKSVKIHYILMSGSPP